MFPDSEVPIRVDIVEAHRRAWDRISRPGTWLTGAERVEVAAAVRESADCRLCAARKEALSPEAVRGTHDHAGGLPEAEVEAVHRIAQDPARLTRGWYDGLGIEAARYVELVGVVAVTVSLDTFARAMGLAPRTLPEPREGEPDRCRPPSARMEAAWVPLIVPGEETGAEANIYEGLGGPYIHRALTLVPDAKRAFFDLAETQYIPGRWMREFDVEHRAITHAQMELLAGRISALNQCLY